MSSNFNSQTLPIASPQQKPSPNWKVALPDESAYSLARELEMRAAAANQPFVVVPLSRGEGTRATVVGVCDSVVVFFRERELVVSDLPPIYLVIDRRDIYMRCLATAFVRQALEHGKWYPPPDFCVGKEWLLEADERGRIKATIDYPAQIDTGFSRDATRYIELHSVQGAPKNKVTAKAITDGDAGLSLRPLQECRP